MWKQLRMGMAAFAAGQRMVWVEHPGLLRYAVIPVLLGGAITVLAVWGGHRLVTWGFDAVWGAPDATWLAWIREAAYAVAWVVTMAGALLVAYLGFLVVCAPFNDALSERVEVLLGTWEPTGFSPGALLVDVVQSIAVETRKVVRQVVWLALWYAVGLVIPVVGAAVYAVGAGYVAAFFFGCDYVDWSLARRSWAASRRLDLFRSRRWSLVGFGLCVVAATAVPLLPFALWPGTVAGGTVLATKILEDS